MSISNINQPIIINIDKGLRIRKPMENEYEIALSWYKDEEILRFSEGVVNRVYTMEDIHRMYEFLRDSGELYFIEIQDESWKIIGDVTLSDFNLPITIGDKRYWGQGIGKKVLATLINRGESIGFKYLRVNEVLSDNIRSKRLYESLGFEKILQSETITSYRLILKNDF